MAAAFTHLPISSLPVWQTLNDVSFVDTRIAEIPGKGYGLVANRSLTTAKPTFHRSSLVSVPHNLILNAETVEQYAKQDRNFRQLLEVVGRQSERGDVLLFLLVQVVLGLKPPGTDSVALPTIWTEYVKFLPADIPLPTMWSDTERLLLQGTSLEAAVQAKRIALEYEFDQLHEKSSDIPYWQAAFWDDERAGTGPQLHHWFLVDAWYRSRCLELPQSGPAMVPCIDLVNHGSAPNAYYEENEMGGGAHGGEISLLLRPQQSVAASDEITISYSGGDGDGDGDDDHCDTRKPASEMLFSYGFVDPHSIRQCVILPYRPLPDDPLAKAKLHVFGSPGPRLEIERFGAATDDDDDDDDNDGCKKVTPNVRWTCPFAYLACVNEEDGLAFQLRAETDGTQQLRAFWQEEDVTEKGRDFESLTKAHPLSAVFQLRVVTMLEEVLEAQLDEMQSAAADDTPIRALQQQQQQLSDNFTARPDVAKQAGLLRDIESRVISSVLEALETERSKLLTDTSVLAYLGSMDIAENDLADEEASNQKPSDEMADGEDADDDFS
ncbi:set domain containing protein [Grosmannia clavigera kw1407]|uniref:Set domain containing protein n=1 Tax=Grosmannia clavigera (strain kw1407 / UAMH 11150) TaxID=655863 RepID=F0XG84_GROCL|nr:set domain containing protein [Grosmannia clavigera kw1407]EFX03245.1 set domain containing protein [Grosmannia clavigera kw1407]